ncbi:SRPBCC family protein [soil metagenome]
MTELNSIDVDPTTDLVLERLVDVSPAAVWDAWTIPEQLVRWFTPAPWSTVSAELDVRPGGRMHTVMASPEGEQYPSTGCYLEVVDGRRLIWTSALGPGYRPVPVPEGEFHMTAIIDIVAEGSGTRYTAIALHDNEAARKQHEEMGFHDGWSAALDQMVAMIKG